MLNRLFDSPAQLIILLVVILLVFGASRLPNTARQLGRSMRIFKSEMKEMKSDAPARPADKDEDGLKDDEASRIEALEGRIIDRNDSRGTRDRTGDSVRADGDR